MKNSWFKNAKCGLIVHFGIYSLLGGEYKGKKMESYCEWIQSYARIGIGEYEAFAKKFNPQKFDAEALAKFAADNNFGYLIFTAKHHDGFCMFDSKYDDFNIMNTPYKRDIIKDLAEACKKYGVRFGIYYSQDLDWHEKNGGGYNSPNLGCAGSSWCNDWDYPNKNDKDYEQYFNKKVVFQVKELCQNYGQIDLFWFDTPNSINKSQSQNLYDLVKKYQPNCLINSRLGNGSYDYVTLGDNEIPDALPKDNLKVDLNALNGFKFSKDSLYESVCTLNKTWGFSKFDNNYKSVEELVKTKQKLSALGINFTINLAPNEEGEIDLQSLEILKELNKKA